jgi:DnaJ-class molecular chaperone
VFAGAGFGPGGSAGRGGGPGGATYEFRTTGGGFGFDEILRDLFGQGAARGRRGPSPRDFEGAAGFGVPAEDVRTRLEIPFLDAVRGASRRVSLPDGSTVDLKIPSGVESGQVLRLKGKVPAPSGGRAGDLLVEIEVTPHPLWRRSGLDLELEQEVPLPVAVLGGKLRVETPEGEIRLSVPRHSSSGRRLRVKGRGIVDAKTGRRGDLFVRLLVTVPPHADAALDAAVRDWAQRHGIAIGD